MTVRRSRAAGVSIVSNTALIALKIVAGVLTGSVAVLTEALHSGIDLLASLIAFFSVRRAEEPADAGHDLEDDQRGVGGDRGRRGAAARAGAAVCQRPSHRSSSRAARPRCEIASFSASESSASVRSGASTGTNSGS